MVLQWKLILLTWSYEHNMAIPRLGKNKKYTGGLSRLLVTGFTKDICKADYAALYPTTEITWNIEPDTDFTHVTLKLLTYVLTQREYHKGIKKKSEKEAENLYNILNELLESDSSYQSTFEKRENILADKIFHDNQQLVLKKLANSWFGSLGCPSLNPWGDLNAAEKTTCIGRMLLRIMIYYLKNLGYEPIVGDSFTGDTPLFIKYDNIWICGSAHAAWNFSQGILFGFAVSGQTGTPSLLKCSQVGQNIISGGQFGPESSLIATFVIIIGLILALYIKR